MKDMFWAMTFVCLGLGSLALLFSRKLEEGSPGGAILFLLIPLLLMPGVLFGAALGRLSHRTERCILIGMAAEFVFVIAYLMTK